MWTFAWRNLLTRPLRTTLALIGLSIPILGVLGLFSLSGGLRNLVGDTLSQIQGLMVLRENAPTPYRISVALGDRETMRAGFSTCGAAARSTCSATAPSGGWSAP